MWIMNKIRRYFYSGLALVAGWMMCGNVAVAATHDTQVHIMDQNVKSLKVAPASNMYLPPILVMGSDDRLVVNFDYIDYDVHYLRYSVTHCNADWQPSQLAESEYVDGFNYADIDDYAQCEGTFTHYFNYQFLLPNENMRLLKSGNYLLSVYHQDDPDHILFQTRFSLCENTVSVASEVTSRTDVDYNDKYQQLGFDVRFQPGMIADPYGELTVRVMQNSREDNAVTLTRPSRVGVGTVTYEHTPQLIFAAGNEFRRIETVSIHSLNMGVASIRYFEPYYHATLQVDYPRNEEQYLYDQTQHGHFTIRNSEANNSETEADYVVTHFTLDTGGPLGDGDLLLEGEFTRGWPLSMRRMKYDATSGCYTADVLLKQGAYNYMYLWYPTGYPVGLTSTVEGDKYQTINEYLIMVYDRPSGERYDRFIGYGIIYSGR